jgi:DNA topoisomerase-1
MSNALLIVESPAKMKTISKLLGSGYTVRPTMGHIVDLSNGRGGDNLRPLSAKENLLKGNR